MTVSSNSSTHGVCVCVTWLLIAVIIGQCGTYNKIQCQEHHWGPLYWITPRKDVGQDSRDCTLIMSHQNRYIYIYICVCAFVCRACVFSLFSFLSVCDTSVSVCESKIKHKVRTEVAVLHSSGVCCWRGQHPVKSQNSLS